MKKKRFAGIAPAWKIGGVAMALCMAIGITSCGGGNDDPNSVKLEVKPELGDLSNYLTIDSKEAIISLSEFTDDGEPYIKLASTLQVKVSEDVATNYDFDLDVVILDKDMNELTDFGDYEIDDKTDYDAGEYDHYLKAGDYRAVMDVKGPKKDWDGKASAMWDMIREKGKYIVLKPEWDSAKFKPYTGSVSKDSESEDVIVADEVEVDTDVVAASSEDWDKILDEYEKYCDKTIALAKKAQAGDISAMGEYASLLESAQSLQKKLENAGSNLSAAQTERLSKIAVKMANSMM